MEAGQGARGLRLPEISENMNKIILIIILLTMSLIAGSTTGGSTGMKDPADGVSADKLTSLISEFSGKEGFDVVRIGRLGTSAIKSFLRLGTLLDGDDEDARALKDVIGGLRKLAIVDYGECSESDRQKFERKLGRLLRDEDMIMEAKDGGDAFKIYGVVDETTDKLRNFVLYDPSDCSLICLFGSISMSAVASAMEL